MDLEGMSKRDFMKFQDPRASKLSTMYLQEALPFRVNKMIYLNMPTFFELFLKAASVWFSEKLKSKILMLQKDLTPAYESVPGLEELMPAEYNGGNCSFEEICEKNIKEFSKIPKNYLDFGISVDEAKRPSDSKNLMRVYKDLSPELMGISGNYVKIEDEI
uniref:Alpha-tocopherol transfer protein-like n=2 Tax=Schistocephalus solidus TaxID=70667 RepID=A0A0X3P4I0_SCHSO